MVGLLGDRIRHAVFIGCTVPEDGTTCISTLGPSFRERGTADGDAGQPQAMNEQTAKLVLGDDLSDEQFAWCVERLVPEAPGLTNTPVDLAPLREHPSVRRTWVRTLRDLIVPADRQTRFAGNVGDCTIVDIDFGHMCFVGRA